MKDFVYAEDQEVVSNKFITVDLPQGPATVCLFQKNPQYANTSPMAIALMLNMDPSKMPAKENELKYDYGTFVSACPRPLSHASPTIWVRSRLICDDPDDSCNYSRNSDTDGGTALERLPLQSLPKP
jgi:hypothetical protein